MLKNVLLIKEASNLETHEVRGNYFIFETCSPYVLVEFAYVRMARTKAKLVHYINSVL